MIRLQIASIPFFPRTFKNNWPIGKGRSVVNKSATDAVAKEAAMSRSQPRI